ncbi:MAG: UDP-3-O-acyl-N-acetylglucosamine deacetylase [Deltaproteobacteria bacterium]|jgi:UDP-3-O-[3-hydroxymyristoyl] N-acetylglucosamine deacetylase|nr:UDP-3-O-acyl-N-acetylglucosamine deacetylase [Deltaproteobacteria bacterium]
MHRHQKTIKHSLKIRGQGLHTGENVEVTVHPRPIDFGIWFKRTDLGESSPILAAAANVSDTTLATSIGWGPQKVGTLEHLLAALGGLGINNILVEVKGPEIPIFDGSAEPWVNFLKAAGSQILNAPRPFYRVLKPLTLTDGDKFLAVEPAPNFSVDFTIDFKGFVKVQKRRFKFSEGAFVTEISPARTFCSQKDVEALRAKGLALGGSLENALVLGEDGYLNPEGPRFPDECVRHKILDLIGDLTLAQTPILGHFTAHKTGHAINQKILSALLNEPGYLEKYDPRETIAKSAREFAVTLKPTLTPSLLGPDGPPLNPIFLN